MSPVNLKKYNYLKLVQDFNNQHVKDTESENNLTEEESKQIDLLEYTLIKLKLLPKEYIGGKTNIPVKDIKENKLKQPYICKGGSCGHGICSKIGEITMCDSGCTYLG